MKKQIVLSLIFSVLFLQTALAAELYNWDGVKPVRLGVPQWNVPAVQTTTGVNPAPLKTISVTPNKITDDENWIQTNQLSICFWALPHHFGNNLPAVPAQFPVVYQSMPVTAAWHISGTVFFVYADSVLIAADSLTGKPICAYDLGAYMYSPKAIETDRMFIRQEIRFARLEDSVLYIANFHNTYAKSSGNQNGYLTAVDLRTNTVKWRSAALVNNTSTFVIKNGFIYCGYGFTNEPDFMYLLNLNTGTVARSMPVKSGPSAIIAKGNKLYVRTYNTDYVFDITVRKHQ
jgi:outer membrane protein assembly factor BamB